MWRNRQGTIQQLQAPPPPALPLHSPPPSPLLTCGSIMSGHLLPLVTITPFSVLKLSLGRPWMFQSRTFLGSARNSAKSKCSEAGMCSDLTWGSHVWRTCWRQGQTSTDKKVVSGRDAIVLL